MALSITVYALPPEPLFLDVKVIKKYSLCEGSGDDCGFVENRKQTNKQTNKENNKKQNKGKKSSTATKLDGDIFFLLLKVG